MVVRRRCFSRLLCIISILLRRNERNDSHFEVVKELEMLSMSFRSLLIVEKRVFGILLPDYYDGGVVEGACTVFVLLLVQSIHVFVESETSSFSMSFGLAAMPNGNPNFCFDT